MKRLSKADISFFFFCARISRRAAAGRFCPGRTGCFCSGLAEPEAVPKRRTDGSLQREEYRLSFFVNRIILKAAGLQQLSGSCEVIRQVLGLVGV